MKKLLSVFLVFIMSFSLFSCVKEEETKRSRSKKESNKKEITVIDNEFYSVTYRGFNDGSRDDPKEENIAFSLDFNFVTKNSKEDSRLYLLKIDYCYINGAHCYPDFKSVDFWDEIEYTFIFSENELSQNGVTDFTDFEITMTLTEIITDENGENDFVDLCTDTFHIYPYGEDKVEPYTKVKYVNREDELNSALNSFEEVK